jgi:hypothetical protein
LRSEPRDLRQHLRLRDAALSFEYGNQGRDFPQRARLTWPLSRSHGLVKEPHYFVDREGMVAALIERQCNGNASLLEQVSQFTA